MVPPFFLCKTSQFTSEKVSRKKIHLPENQFSNSLGPFYLFPEINHFCGSSNPCTICENQSSWWTTFRTQNFDKHESIF